VNTPDYSPSNRCKFPEEWLLGISYEKRDRCVYRTINVIGVVCIRGSPVKLVAVPLTDKLYVWLPCDALERLLLPQPTKPIIPMRTSAIRKEYRWNDLRFVHSNIGKRNRHQAISRIECVTGSSAYAGVWMLKTTLAEPVPGTTCGGANVAVNPFGRPLMLMSTMPVKGDGCAAILKVYTAMFPACTVCDELPTGASVKSGVAPTVVVTAADELGAKVASPPYSATMLCCPAVGERYVPAATPLAS
jgi:hypothetical protein